MVPARIVMPDRYIEAVSILPLFYLDIGDFSLSCHGAGRTMSRVKATKQFRAEEIIKNLAKKGIIVKGHGFRGIAEEAPDAYKNVEDVIEGMHETNIARKVVRLKPLISIKG